ncbi:uncharacterized protein V6R79_007516 [Siganus canaliculatus]
MTSSDKHNLTRKCAVLSHGNQTELRVTERLDVADCLFLSVLPHAPAVPLLISTFVFLTVVSLLVNGLTLFGLERSDDLSFGPRTALFRNLILSDLMQTINIAPAVIHSLVQRRTMSFSIWCHVQYFVGCSSVFSSLVTITCMALERYLYVCHAIHYLVILTPVRQWVTLSIIWIYSISISTISMVLIHTGGAQQHEQDTRGLLCEPDMMEQHLGFPRAAAIFRKVIGTSTLLLCLLLYVFSYMSMYADARNAMIPFNAVNNVARRTVLFYCGMLFLQLLPLLLKVTSDMLWELEGSVAMTAQPVPFQSVHRAWEVPSVTAAVFHMLLLVMMLVPPCINPLVYGLRNVEMRRALLRPFRWCTVRRGFV